MESFPSPRDAKEYLIGRILAQAKLDGVNLSEVERKMLYFSETGWTLPDMKEASAEFDRDYNEGEYERKIGTLIRHLSESQDETAYRRWDDAVRVLSTEDHYLLVLVNSSQESAPAARPRGDLYRLIITAAVLVFALVATVRLVDSLNLSRTLSHSIEFGAFAAALGGLKYFKVVR